MRDELYQVTMVEVEMITPGSGGATRTIEKFIYDRQTGLGALVTMHQLAPLLIHDPKLSSEFQFVELLDDPSARLEPYLTGEKQPVQEWGQQYEEQGQPIAYHAVIGFEATEVTDEADKISLRRALLDLDTARCAHEQAKDDLCSACREAGIDVPQEKPF